MVNAWTWGLLAGVVAATVLTLLLARVLKRGWRTAALGALLVPVTGLWLWAFGITAENQQTVTTQSFSTVIAVGKAVRGTLTPANISNWLSLQGPAVPVAVPSGQAWVSLDFPLDVGGRPVLAWPAFTLVAVELMFLGAAVAGVLAMLVMNRLPRLHHPLFDIDEFHFASSDKFFLAVLADDAEFGAARDFLSGLGPVRLAEAPGAEAA